MAAVIREQKVAVEAAFGSGDAAERVETVPTLDGVGVEFDAAVIEQAAEYPAGRNGQRRGLPRGWDLSELHLKPKPSSP